MSDQQQQGLQRGQLLAGGATFATAAAIDAVAHLGPTGLLIGGIGAIIAARHGHDIVNGVKTLFPDLPSLPQATPGQRSILDRALGRFPEPAPATAQEDGPETEETEQEDGLASPDDPFSLPMAHNTPPCARLTVDQCVAAAKRYGLENSYSLFIGRSLTAPNHPAVKIKIYKQHFRFMGASQRGKSSMLAAFLETVTRTHDPKHVRLILLDKEDQTSNLFAHLPHVLTMRKADGRVVKMHARNVDEVLQYLLQSVVLMKKRVSMPKSQLLELPIILVYIEEFLATKNELRARIAIAKNKSKEEQDKAESDYASFVYCINTLAQEGLKARVQMLLCAQVEYADDDFKEALVSVQCGFSFCVRPKAAEAAGFMNNELIRRNAKENQIGQAVVECPDCNDLVLAPEYDLERRILEQERSQSIYNLSAPGNAEMDVYSPVNMPVNGSTSPFTAPSQGPHLHLLVNNNPERESPEPAPVNENGNAVSDEVKDIIRRLHGQGIKHNMIAKAVKLDGRNYGIYRQVCREIGIAEGA